MGGRREVGRVYIQRGGGKSEMFLMTTGRVESQYSHRVEQGGG